MLPLTCILLLLLRRCSQGCTCILLLLLLRRCTQACSCKPLAQVLSEGRAAWCPVPAPAATNILFLLHSPHAAAASGVQTAVRFRLHRIAHAAAAADAQQLVDLGRCRVRPLGHERLQPAG